MKSIIELFLEYITSRSTFRLIVELLAIMFFFTWIFAGYEIVTNFSAVRTVIEEVMHASEHVDVKAAAELNTKIDSELNTLLHKTGADRVFLSKFHDGKTDLQGLHFVFSSRTNEVTTDGVASTILNNQNIPLAVFNTTEQLTMGNCIVYYEIKKTDMSWYEFWKQQGINSVIRCPVFNSTHVLVGEIGVDYVAQHPEPAKKEVEIGMIRATGERISAILQFASKE